MTLGERLLLFCLSNWTVHTTWLFSDCSCTEEGLDCPPHRLVLVGPRRRWEEPLLFTHVCGVCRGKCEDTSFCSRQLEKLRLRSGAGELWLGSYTGAMPGSCVARGRCLCFSALKSFHPGRAKLAMRADRKGYLPILVFFFPSFCFWRQENLRWDWDLIGRSHLSLASTSFVLGSWEGTALPNFMACLKSKPGLCIY